ncbi:hypothetical protein C8Q79DRAFT_1005932 [Trametes meyenii]|nr:hypothetical protein C8Q79DRAFT_1005932 [Trametes meyenii]
MAEPQELPSYKYAFTRSFLQFDADAMGDEEGVLERFEFRVLPGAVRPLVYTALSVHLLSGIWIRALVRARDAQAAQAIAEALMMAEGGLASECRYLSVAKEDLRGVSAIAWNETIGRLCVAYAGMARVEVSDFATAPLRG